MLLHRCMHCLAGGACELRFDKKSRPYTACKFCRAVCFLPSLQCLKGIAVAPGLLETAIRRREADPEFARAFDANISAVLQYVTDQVLNPQPLGAQRALPPDTSGIVPFDERKAVGQ